MGGGTSFPVVRLPKDRIIIITGANSGLGYEIAKWSAMMGATVIVACRSEARALEAIDQMKFEFEVEKSRGTENLTDTLALEFMQVDLGSFKSVINFVEEFKRSGRKLHVLFCNAGLGLGPYVKTEDGLEMLLQVNYLSHFLMITKLLPIMKESGPDCRILLMSSGAQRFGVFQPDTMDYKGPPDKYPPLDYYSRTKLYQIMQMYSMHKRLNNSNITVNSINPGAVATRFGRDAEKCLFRCILACVVCCPCFVKKADRGARCSIDCATNPNLAGTSGVFFKDFKRETPIPTAMNEELQEQLWNKSFEYLKDYITEEDKQGMNEP